MDGLEISLPVCSLSPQLLSSRVSHGIQLSQKFEAWQFIDIGSSPLANASTILCKSASLVLILVHWFSCSLHLLHTGHRCLCDILERSRPSQTLIICSTAFRCQSRARHPGTPSLKNTEQSECNSSEFVCQIPTRSKSQASNGKPPK